jgi:hypothetical protein
VESGRLSIARRQALELPVADTPATNSAAARRPEAPDIDDLRLEGDSVFDVPAFLRREN